MPCMMMQDFNPSDYDAREARRLAEKAVAEANLVTDLLCRVLRALPHDTVARLDDDTRAWFEAHKKHDAESGR